MLLSVNVSTASNVSGVCYNSTNQIKKGHKMSLSLINKLYKGCLFIHNGENFLVNEITVVNDSADIVNAILVNAKGDFVAITCTPKEFLESVVK